MKKLIIFVLVFLSISTFATDNIRKQVAECYESQVGVRELTGNNDGVEVEMYLKSVGLGKGYAWCAAFVNWVLEAAGIQTIRNAWSPAWFPESKVIYKSGVATKTPRQGDVFGIYNVSLKRIAHVGFVDSWSAETVVTVEGNTNLAGSREGDGVYKKVRLTRQINKVARWIE